MPIPRSASSSDESASFLKARRIPSINPIGIPSERYSGRRLASIRQTTLTGPPASTTYWNSRSILSRTRSIAARINVPISGTAIVRARYRSIRPSLAKAVGKFGRSARVIMPQGGRCQRPLYCSAPTRATHPGRSREEGRSAFRGGAWRLGVAGEGRGDGARKRTDREGLPQQLVAAEVVTLALADIAGDEQHREVAGARRLQVTDELGA